MFSLNDSNSYYFYPHPTDMRKSSYALSGIVKNEMGRDVQDGDVFIFINRSLTSMKLLHLEYGGLVIYNMKLEKGCFHLPDFDTNMDGDIYPSSWSDLMLMVQGISLSEVRRSPRWVSDKKTVKDKHFEKAMNEPGKDALNAIQKTR